MNKIMAKRLANQKMGREISFGTTLTTASGGALIGGGFFGMPGAVVGAVVGAIFGISATTHTTSEEK